MSESAKDSANGRPVRLESNAGSIKQADGVLASGAANPPPKKGNRIVAKIKVTRPVQAGKEAQAEWVPPPWPGQRKSMTAWLIPACSVVLLIAALVVGYLRFVKSVDIFQPARNRIATASYVLFRTGDQVVVSRDDLTYLVSNSEKAAKSPGRIIVVQTNYVESVESNATGEAAAEKTAATPAVQWEWMGTNEGKNVASSEPAQADKPGTNAAVPEAKPEQSGPVDNAAARTVDEGAARPASNAPVAQAEQKPAVALPVAAPAVVTENDRRAALVAKAETGDAEAQCKLGDYYNSIGDGENACEWYRRAADQELPRALCRYGDCLMRGWGTDKDQPAAVEAYKKAAARDNPEGQTRLADCYLAGEFIPQDSATARQLYEKAAKKNHPEAICRLGECALRGSGMDKNINQALLCFKQAADLGYIGAYCRMAEVYENGLFGAANPAMALTMYKKAADMNNVEARGRLALYYYAKIKTAPHNRVEMVRWLKAAATNSMNNATRDDAEMLVRMYLLSGDCLMDGAHMEKNMAAGAGWYEKAAATGEPEGLYKYGLCRLKGTGVKQDQSEGYAMLLKAADAKYAQAEWMIGECYLHGTGIEYDRVKAKNWFGKAASHGVPEAQYRMGESCLNGTNTGLDRGQQAFNWFLKSAEQDYAPAIEKVVECYDKGLGTKKDVKKLAIWRAKLPRTRSE